MAKRHGLASLVTCGQRTSEDRAIENLESKLDSNDPVGMVVENAASLTVL